jgi:hypothetical protein
MVGWSGGKVIGRPYRPTHSEERRRKVCLLEEGGDPELLRINAADGVVKIARCRFEVLPRQITFLYRLAHPLYLLKLGTVVTQPPQTPTEGFQHLLIHNFVTHNVIP